MYAYAIGSCVGVQLKVCPVAERETYGMRTENREERGGVVCRVACRMFVRTLSLSRENMASYFLRLVCLINDREIMFVGTINSRGTSSLLQTWSLYHGKEL